MTRNIYDYAPLLATLQRIAPEAHIAGGAVRDTILEKSLHDIDIFMDDQHVEQAAALLRSACSYVKVGEWIPRLQRSGDDARSEV
jgi:tRNA nucleotidyltransferase/poly(A) polymerase